MTIPITSGGGLLMTVSASALTVFGHSTSEAAYVLTSPTGTKTGETTATWSVTLNAVSGGTIFAAVRLNSDPVLPKEYIESGGGDAVANSSDASPTAGSGNGGSFTGLSPATTYAVDMFYRDGSGEESDRVTSSSFTTNGTFSSGFTISGTENSVTAAPHGVWMSVGSFVSFPVSGPGGGETYDPRLHEVTYVWDFGDTSEVFAPPEGINLPTAWNDRNVAYGYQVFHVWETPGSYTVTCKAYHNGSQIAQETFGVTVTDADDDYPTSQTFVFSTDGGDTFAGKPAGATEFTSLSALDTALQSAGSETRVLFKRGQTIADFALNRFQDKYVSYWGAWGTGDDPVLQINDTLEGIAVRAIEYKSNSGTIDGVTFTNIKFEGRWDATTETGDRLAGGAVATYNAPFSGVFMFHKVTVTGFSQFYNRPDYRQTGVLAFSECLVTNWKDYGIIVYDNPDGGSPPTVSTQLGKLVYVGSSIRQATNALQGRRAWHGSRSAFNTHGPTRIIDTPNVYIGGCDFYSRNGWSVQASDTAEQPCLRLNAGSAHNLFYNVERCACEGGGEIINAVGLSGGLYVDGPGNYVFDKMLLCATAKLYEDPIRWDKGGTTFRNILCVVPNVPQWHGFGSQEGCMFNFDANGATTSANNAAEINVYNCTGLNLRDSTNDLGWAWDLIHHDGHFTALTTNNNIMHGPNLDTPVTTAAPIDVGTAIPGFTPRYPGIRHNFEEVRGSDVGGVGNGSSLTGLDYPPGTNQAFCQANEDGTGAIIVEDIGLFNESLGEISFTFGASTFSVTNSSGETWPSGKDYQIRMPLSGSIPAMDTSYANPSTIPAPRPSSGSSALDGATTGLKAYDDLLGAVRPSTANQGALEDA